MDSTEHLIIKKLIKIFANQQKVLAKIAQLADADEDVEATKKYLQEVWMTAGVNSGLRVETPEVTYVAGSTSNTGNRTIVQSSQYNLVGAIPASDRQKFSDTFDAQIKSQKPELDGRVGVIFTDPQ